MRTPKLALAALLMAVSIGIQAQDRAAEMVLVQDLHPSEGEIALKDFKFGSGETLPTLRIHYRTLGTPRRDAAGEVTNAVMVLHGTGGSGKQFMAPQFAGELFGPGQPLDLARYYVILPDDIGHGQSSKPSDGLRAKFPHYDYDDMVVAEHALIGELHVKRLRLLMGTSMGCMHTFLWGEKYPAQVAAMMPLACLPVQIAGRNRMWRKMLMEAIRNDPAWNHGDYTTEPAQGLRTAVDLLLIAGASATSMQANQGTAQEADAYLDSRFQAQLKGLDANDLLYQVDSSRDYDPSAALGKIEAPVMWVNSSDDFINDSQMGVAEAKVKEIRRGRFVLVPASAATHGHGTHTWAVFWKDKLLQLLDASGG